MMENLARASSLRSARQFTFAVWDMIVFSTLRKDLLRPDEAMAFFGAVAALPVFVERLARLSEVAAMSMALELARPELRNELVLRRLPFSTEKEAVPERLVRPLTFFMKLLLLLTSSQTRESGH